MEVDFTGVEGIEAIPDGRYPAIVAVVEEKTSAKDKPYISWQFEIAEGEYKGRKMFNNTSLQPQALWKVKETIVALGIPIKGNKIKINDNDLIGLTCDLMIGQREWEGQMRNEVRQVLPPSGNAPKKSGRGAKGTAPKKTKGGKKGKRGKGF